MKKILTTLFVLFMITMLVTSPVVAQRTAGPIEPQNPAPSAETSEMVDETPQLWFVELSSVPTAEGGNLATITAEKNNFRGNARKAGIRFVERFAYNDLWNGLSVSIKAGDVTKLYKVPGVKALYPVQSYTMPPVERSADLSPELYTSISMIGADIAQSEMGLSGKGVRVAVMDTGIDYNHPDLGGCFGPGCRVYTGWDFVGDDFNADDTAASYNPVPVPDPDPDDCAGHGTHVAGIIGANGTVKGVAPEVKFGAYRVFGCEGSTTSDIMIAAMEKVLKDKMQVLNMSIGASFQWPQYPTAQAANRLVLKGVVVVASIGNSGANGLYSAGAPGVAKLVIGVASYDNTRVVLPSFTASPDGKQISYTAAAGTTALPPTSGTAPLARTGTPATTNDACAALTAGSLTDKVVLIRRGTCAFGLKASNAQAAGAIGVILYNNVAGTINPTVAGYGVTIPVVAITAADGVELNARLDAGPVDITWTDQLVSSPNPTAGLISSFSSYGLTPDLALKPDLGAPGGMIYSTYPLELGGYATLSGTSMSSPHVAGAAALLLQASPRTPAILVKGLLQNSAQPKDWWGYPGAGYLDNVHRQGAGMVYIPASITAKTLIEPSSLSLGESESGPTTSFLFINNQSRHKATYTFSHEPALATGASTFAPDFWDAYADVSFNANSVTVPPYWIGKVKVTITAPPEPVNGIYGGYIVVTNKTDGSVYRVPYAGFIGDYQSIAALTPTIYGFPWLADFDYNQLGDTTFTMQGDDIAYFLLHLDHPVRLLRFEVYDAVTGRYWHMAYNEDYMGRNSTSTSFYAFTWDGKTMNAEGTKVWTVPDGKYIVKISVLKALGNKNNPNHWETWTSPVITIDRP